MAVYIEKPSSSSRELGNGALDVREEHMSAPKTVVRRTNTGGIVADEDMASSLMERSLAEIEDARHIFVENEPDEPPRVKVRKGAWGGVVGTD